MIMANPGIFSASLFRGDGFFWWTIVTETSVFFFVIPGNFCETVTFFGDVVLFLVTLFQIF